MAPPQLEWRDSVCREQTARRDAGDGDRAPLAGRGRQRDRARLGADPDGGAGAPDDLGQAHRTQAWLAASDDPRARVTGKYFYHMRPLEPNPQALDAALQDRLIELCASYSGIVLPG
jgi:hypothetical protein